MFISASREVSRGKITVFRQQQRMNGKIENSFSGYDGLKWTLIIILIMGGIVASTYYASGPVSLKLIGWVIISCISALVAVQTSQGKRAWEFIKEARIELRKVVWPTRQETVQSTLVVVLMVVITALFLWGLDSVLLWLVSLLTGQKG